MRFALLLISAICVTVPAYGQQAAPVAVPVGVVQAERKPISATADFVGHVDAINRVTINARVKGFLDDVLFKEGDVIKEGAPLYKIEPGLFQAAVEQAQGALERSKAAKTLTEIQLQRAQELLTRQAGTAVTRDQALASDQQAQGQILSDEANLQTAKINLGYTDITSPIAGKIGRTNITKGNVVGPDSGALTTIVSQDPMYVTFPVSERDILEVRKEVRTADPKKIKVKSAIFRRVLSMTRPARSISSTSPSIAPPIRVTSALHHRQSEGPPDRRPTGAGRAGKRHAHGERW